MLLGEPLDRNAVIDLAATIEGHPDNSTPAILGGFCVALLENGHVSHVRVPVHGAIDFVVFIPDFQLSTEKARAALPKRIDHHDAVYNLARAALLAGSLTTGKLENLDVATGDCLHQPYRFSLIENGEDIVRHCRHRLQGRPRLYRKGAGSVRGEIPALEGSAAALRRGRHHGKTSVMHTFTVCIWGRSCSGRRVI